MPELPEVEIAKCGIKPFVLGSKITNVKLYSESLRWPIPKDIKGHLVGFEFISLERRGKYLVFSLQRGGFLLHLGMTGYLRIVPVNTTVEEHDHFDIEFQSGHTLRFNDFRRFGSLHWTDETVSHHDLLTVLGPEPFSDIFDKKYLYLKSRSRKIVVKDFIIDQQVVSGIGNIYANESLFYAGILPTTPANKLSIFHCNNLINAIDSVLNKAIKLGGTMLDFRDGVEKVGGYPEIFAVYRRKGEVCRECGAEVHYQRVNRRSMYFCKNCQK